MIEHGHNRHATTKHGHNRHTTTEHGHNRHTTTKHGHNRHTQQQNMRPQPPNSLIPHPPPPHACIHRSANDRTNIGVAPAVTCHWRPSRTKGSGSVAALPPRDRRLAPLVSEVRSARAMGGAANSISTRLPCFPCRRDRVCCAGRRQQSVPAVRWCCGRAAIGACVPL